MKIGGYIPLSLVDYPKKPAITIFTNGCNLRCPFCHNGELVTKTREEKEIIIMQFLKQRKDMVNAVCISGGEPTIQRDLAEFIKRIRSLGYYIKLDTNGSKPEVINKLLSQSLLDYIAIDVKSSPLKYKLATGSDLDFAKVATTVNLIKAGKIDYEIRTTAVPNIVSLEDIDIIIKKLMPIKRYVLQQFRPRQTLDPAFGYVKPYLPGWFEKAKNILEGKVEEVIIRGV